MKPIRLGVIGLGLIWIRTHRPILEGLKENFNLVAFCDLNEERRATVARDFPEARIFSDVQQLLQMPEVEAVLILTPIALNAPTAMTVLQAGKHVIMEKPIARSVAEGQALVAAARQAGKHLFVLEQMGYRSAEDKLADIISSGEIGELIMWDRVFHLEGDTAQGPLRYDTTPWRKEANFPLGTLFDGGIHMIAALNKVFGTPQTVSATGKKLRPEYGEYDQVAMMFNYGGGVSGILSHSSYLSPVLNHFHVYGSQGVIIVEREQMTVKKSHEPDRTVELPSENAYLQMWHALIAAFRENSDPYYTPERALQDVAILEAVDQAIKTGQNQTITKIGEQS